MQARAGIWTGQASVTALAIGLMSSLRARFNEVGTVRRRSDLRRNQHRDIARGVLADIARVTDAVSRSSLTRQAEEIELRFLSDPGFVPPLFSLRFELRCHDRLEDLAQLPAPLLPVVLDFYRKVGDLNAAVAEMRTLRSDDQTLEDRKRLYLDHVARVLVLLDTAQSTRAMLEKVVPDAA